MPRVNIFLEEGLHRRVKVLAAIEDTTLQQEVSELIGAQLEQDLPLIEGLMKGEKRRGAR